MRYRPEIDGLRAIAVLAVVLFHAKVPGFNGGFVGVDVFFVISGYLISGLILNQTEAGTFSFKTFYSRRARRLFPALFFTLALTFGAGAILLPAAPFADLAQTTQAALLAVSNFHFWLAAGYFDSAADTKPLLHTWSLAVEEQYYLLWPALLLLIIRRARRYLIPLLGIMLLASLLSSEFMLSRDAEAAFYLLPFRAFELVLGTLVILLEPRLRIGNIFAEGLLLAGLALIAWSVFTYGDKTPFPGLHALLPCLGTAAALLGGQARISGAFLRVRAVIGIGLISYSLYLIHWPLIVFLLALKTERALGPIDQVGVVGVSFALALLMYRFVERPFRRPRDRAQALSPAGFGLVCTSLALGLLYLAANAWGHEGWPWRVPDQAWAADRPWRKCVDLEDGYPGCAVGDIRLPKPDIMVIGDSHAAVLRAAIDRLARRYGLRANIWTFPGCPAIFGTYKIYAEARLRERQEKCKAQIQAWETDLLDNPYPIIVLASRWTSLLEPSVGGDRTLRRDLLLDREDPEPDPEIARRVFSAKLQETVDRLAQAGSKVIVFSEPPRLRSSPADCQPGPLDVLLGRPRASQCDLIDYQPAMDHLAFSDRIIRGLAAEGVLPVMISDIFCDPAKASCDIARGTRLLYRDDNHLSNHGAMLVARQILEPFADLLGPDA